MVVSIPQSKEVENVPSGRARLKGKSLRLEGIHHVTAITADAPGNVRFYVGVLGLRLVKKSVNQDDPTVYHLFYADERGSAGSDITFFEYPGARRGRAGDGMVHRIVWRVPSVAALDFWERRLGRLSVDTSRTDSDLTFKDPEGLELQLTLDESGQSPLRASHPDIPQEFALCGFDGVRAYTSAPEESASLLKEVLGFQDEAPSSWVSRGEQRSSTFDYDPAPGQGSPGAGTVHHVAWACPMDEHESWRSRLVEAGVAVTPIIDRFYFRSIYFREPSGVLFEIATLGPGFTSDEDLEHLGEKLALPPAFESRRAQLEAALTPLPATVLLTE